MPYVSDVQREFERPAGVAGGILMFVRADSLSFQERLLEGMDLFPFGLGVFSLVSCSVTQVENEWVAEIYIKPGGHIKCRQVIPIEVHIEEQDIYMLEQRLTTPITHIK